MSIRKVWKLNDNSTVKYGGMVFSLLIELSNGNFLWILKNDEEYLLANIKKYQCNGGWKPNRGSPEWYQREYWKHTDSFNFVLIAQNDSTNDNLPTNSCSCNIRDLMNFGCKCGAFQEEKKK